MVVKSLEQISERIAVWRIWATRGQVFPSGYPSITVEARLFESPGSSDRRTPPHPEAEAVERAVRSMPSELGSVFKLQYLGRVSEKERIKAARCTRREYYARLRCAKYWLHGALSKAW